MFNAGSYYITVAELSSFRSDAQHVFTSEEYEELVLYLSQYPDVGEIIQNTGGVRKVRWPARGSGKRGGARVIYYFRDLNMPVYLLAVYAKGEKINLTESEKKQMRRFVEEIANAAMAKRFQLIQRA